MFTPPLRELTPETSYGFDVIDFARDVLGTPLDPWEEWAVIHAGELLEDGITPRFRTVLILVARQNGKTFLLRVLKLYWMFVEQWEVILGTSTDRNYAKKDWIKLCDMAKANPYLRAQLPQKKNLGVNTQIGSEALTTAEGSQYIFAATNRRAGRSLSIDRVVMDELREHTSWDAWNAATNAMNARPYAQAFCITNQGDETGIVLDSLRASALKFIKDGIGDDTLGLLEWSAPDGADVMDPQAWAAANPNLGRRLKVSVIANQAARVKEAGGKEEADFRTEVLCQRVRILDGAIDPTAWEECHVEGDLANLRSRIALCLDVSMDRRHATLVAAAVLEDARVRVETIAAWSGPDTTTHVRRDLSGLLGTIRPQAFGWMPNGPAAALAADLQQKKGRKPWAPAGVAVEEIRGEVSAVCMGLADLVDGRQVCHKNDPLLNDHITGASKLRFGDTWRFSRKGEGHCDGAYAIAGAVHLARTLPTAVGKPRLVIAT